MKDFALAMMVKNEEGHLDKSFRSVSSLIDTIVLLDTGSTDKTIEEAKQWATDNGKIIHVRETIFKNFQDTRNELLDFACEVALEPYLILFDASDELRGDITQLDALVKNEEANAGFLMQQWELPNKSVVQYYNIRVIKNRGGWYYKGVVHEYLESSLGSRCVKLEGVTVYQNRSTDGGKSDARLARDYDMLSEASRKDPTDSRTVFYLARTCESLKKWHESLTYYQLRLTMDQTYTEELYWCHLSSANIFASLGNELQILVHCLDSLNYDYRAEPLVMLGKLYISKHQWAKACSFLQPACSLEYPAHSILFIDKTCYSYERWHLLGIAAFYAGQYNMGREACKRAIDAKHEDIDIKNLQFYDDKIRELTALASSGPIAVLDK